MAYVTDKMFPYGGMDKDSDLSRVGKGDYLDALNIQFLTENGNTQGIPQTLKGNAFAADISSVGFGQQKMYLVTLAHVPTMAHSLDLKLNDGRIVKTVSFVEGATDSISLDNFNSAYIAAPYNPLLGGSHPHSFDNVAGTFNFGIGFSIILAGPDGYDWILSNTIGVANPLVVTISQEAVSDSQAGNMNIIGSYDLLGDLFVFSTNKTSGPIVQQLSITGVTTVGGGPHINEAQITTAVAHNLPNGSLIIISGAGLGLDGQWITSIVDATNFILTNSFPPYNAFVGTATITSNIGSVSEIGVVVYSNDDDTFVYVRLLRSVELNFRSSHQIDCYAERNNTKASFYWTDNFNVPRVFYYEGQYLFNGAITLVNPAGAYSYGNVSDQTTLILSNTKIDFNFTNQSQSGGLVKSGNWRYTVRLLDASLIATDWLDLTNPVPVFAADTGGDPSRIIGSDGNIATGKTNNFIVSGIIPGVFKFIELGAVNYVGDAIIGYNLERVLITSSTMSLSHTGHETTVTDLPLGTINQTSSVYQTAKNINAIDNRLILSNLTTNQNKVLQSGFSAWAATFKHSIKRDAITGVGSQRQGTLVVGEYQSPVNVYSEVGYMHNELYRFGCKVRFKSGGVSDIFWIDDIRVDTRANNTPRLPTLGDPTPPANPDDRRVVGLTDYNLTTSGVNPAPSVYTTYVEFSNINLSYLINGVPVRNLIDRIYFERVELASSQREVVATGMFNPAMALLAVVRTDIYNMTNDGGDLLIYTIAKNNLSVNQTVLVTGTLNHNGSWFIHSLFGNFAFKIKDTLLGGAVAFVGGDGPGGYVGLPASFAGDNAGNTNLVDHPFSGGALALVSRQSYQDVNQERHKGSFYSPDILFGTTSLGILAGDKINLYGSPLSTYSEVIGSADSRTAVVGNYSSTYREYNGYFGGTSILLLDVQDLINVSFGGTASFPTDSIVYKKKLTVGIGTSVINLNVTGSPVIKVGGGGFVQVTAAARDEGFYYGQYYRPITYLSKDLNKFGPSYLGTYAPTGSFIDITTLSPTVIGVGVIKVFGGDTFTQKTYMKLRVNETSLNIGLNSGVGFYSQNITNSQMHFDGNAFPYVTIVPWLDNTVADNNFSYNRGYSIKNGVNSDLAFNSSISGLSTTGFSRRPVTIAYSLLKPQDSLQDQYRVFLPLNFKDLDLSFGEIMHHANVNGELYTWQPRKVQRQFFNTRSTFQGGDGSQVIIGDGTVLSRDGQTVTLYGTNHKWSVVKGKSKRGNDVVYWFNTEMGNVLRFAGDGPLNLADTNGLQSFFSNNLRFVHIHDTPANGSGICGVWNDRYGDVVWSIRASKGDVPTYVGTLPYNLNDVISFILAGVTEFYQSNSVTPMTGVAPPDARWTLIPHTNNQYYNEYTIVFNEPKSKFTTFYSFVTKIFLQWRDKYFTPAYQIGLDSGRLYLHDSGQYCSWYDGAIVKDGYIDMLYNKDEMGPKMFNAFLINSELTPRRLDLTTRDHVSFLLDTDFEPEFDMYAAGIKNDSTGTGVNDADTSNLWGKYIRVKMTFQALNFQRLVDFVIKYVTLHRNYKK